MAAPDALPASDERPLTDLPASDELPLPDLSTADERPAKGFKPKKLCALSVDAPMRRNWDVMGADESKRLHAKAQAEALRFSWTGPVTRKRLKRYLGLTPIGFALLGFFFVGGDLRTTLYFLFAGVPLGALVMLLKPSDYLCGALYALCGLAAMLLAGRMHLLMMVLAMSVMGSIGIIVGRGEEYRRIDGED